VFALWALVSAAIARSADAAVVTAQLLDYENGYVFLTTGDGFRVSPSVAITSIATGSAAASPPRARQYARLTFDPIGIVTKIEISQKPLPPEGDLSAIRHFAIALSSPQPNPDLGPQPTQGCARVIAGRNVKVTFNVQVPPTTALTDTIYMTTDQSGWNAQAYRLDRVDALHYRTEISFSSGTILHYLFDRGSTQSIELAQNGIEQKPRLLCIGDADAQAAGPHVYHWGDETVGGTLPIPQTFPTPFNPAPFPNLPTPQPRPT
ncbi:MAG TPA: hypothetical protein VGR69_02185, partial [Candidatus Rubrimentiphilum sp.]|nr:hypothetical protein [Candidatus Rubrimentiphilum sp.]